MMIKTKLILASLCALVLSFNACAQNGFNDFSSKFIRGYKSLNIGDLELSYVSGLKSINATDVEKQTAFFKSVQTGISKYKRESLTKAQRLDYDLIGYETRLNLEHLNLETVWLKNPPKAISEAGLATVPNGKAWYIYLLKRWVSADVTPDEIFNFGLKEIDRVNGHIEAIRKQTGLSEEAFYKQLNDPAFFTNDPKAIQDSFENVKTVIYSNLNKVFNPAQIPALKIERGTEKALAQTPGFYRDDIFYYNLFDKPYCTRQFDWLFIHEGVPGHHYQTSINHTVKGTAVQDVFYYIGFAEGWGAYAEELGKQLGVCKTPYAELGKWEWDIVRSVRVPMDVGLNYYGWTDEQALAFWKKHVKNQDEIAMREINRMKRWPAQVVTYKYGAAQIMQWKEEMQQKQGKSFDIRNFHDRLLRTGNVPLAFMRGLVFDGV